MRIEPTVDKDDARKWPPWSTQIDALVDSTSCEATTKKNETRVLGIAGTKMRSDIAVSLAMNSAIFKHCRGAAKNEVDVTFDVAIFEKLTPTIYEQRILPTQEATVQKHRTISIHKQGDSL